MADMKENDTIGLYVIKDPKVPGFLVLYILGRAHELC
jgi:hypothetical protein